MCRSVLEQDVAPRGAPRGPTSILHVCEACQLLPVPLIGVYCYVHERLFELVHCVSKGDKTSHCVGLKDEHIVTSRF